jgi:hypothetical protein
MKTKKTARRARCQGTAYTRVNSLLQQKNFLPRSMVKAL